MSTGASSWPPGQEMLPQRFVDDGKRVRCMLAVAELAHDEGPARVGTTEVVRRARLSRNTFYELFGGIEEGLQFAWQQSGLWLSRPVVEAIEASGGPGAARVEAAIDALLGAIAEHPLIAELYLVHAPGLVGAEAGLRDALIEPLSAVLGEGARQGGLDGDSQDKLPELVAGGIVSVIALRLRRGEAGTLPGLRGELVALSLPA